VCVRRVGRGAWRTLPGEIAVLFDEKRMAESGLAILTETKLGGAARPRGEESWPPDQHAHFTFHIIK